MGTGVAHIADSAPQLHLWFAGAALVLAATLTIEHQVVKHGSATAAFAASKGRLLAAVTTLGIVMLCALSLPTTQAQEAAGPLPDLISDPPRPSFVKELNGPDGDTRLVLTFDGYVHNIGEGALDVVGNPQEADGMRQRVRDDDDWVDVGAPTVRYEVDDGHNHFHLIEAIEYVLWNEALGSQTAIGSKIGFCLVDSELMEPGVEASYSEDKDNFCQEGKPDATSLRMGISPGWRDIYDATTTLQWVDVSNVVPGRYWIGAITDPNDEIVESNEDNNGLIFSSRTIAVPGFAPRPQPAIAVDDTETTIALQATSHGDVTQPVFVIEEAPAGGVLDVPIGADLTSPDVRYRPEPGFTGRDQIVFSVRDAGSPYPFDAPNQTIDLDVTAPAGDAPDLLGALPTLNPPSTFFELAIGEAFSVEIAPLLENGDPARLFTTGLPAGLVSVADDGLISGSAIESGIFEVELIALGDDPSAAVRQPVTFIVNPADESGGLAASLDRSSPRNVATSLRMGTLALGQTFEASGLPPGLAILPTSPVVTGTPTDIGDYAVELRELQDGEVIATSSFTWTIRPTTDISFAL